MQQASWCYRCAEALCWCSVGAAWERMQASWCYRGAGGSVLVAMVQQGNGCNLPAVAIDALRPWAGSIGAACQLVLSMR